jgi:hypothetical protein
MNDPISDIGMQSVCITVLICMSVIQDIFLDSPPHKGAASNCDPVAILKGSFNAPELCTQPGSRGARVCTCLRPRDPAVLLSMFQENFNGWQN